MKALKELARLLLLPVGVLAAVLFFGAFIVATLLHDAWRYLAHRTS